MDSNKVDQGARAEDVGISDQTVDVEEEPLEVEERAKLPTHDLNHLNSFLRKSSILKHPNEQVDAVPYSVALGLQNFIKPKTPPVLYLFLLSSNISSFSGRLRKSSVVCSGFRFISCNGCAGLDHLHFQNEFGSFNAFVTNFLQPSKHLLFLWFLFGMDLRFRRSWCRL